MAREFEFRAALFSGLDGDLSEHADSHPGASPDMLNFTVTPDGELIRRAGCELLCEKEEPLRGIWCGALSDGTLYAAVFGDTLYASGAGFDALTPVAGAVPGTGEVRFFPFLGALYLLTGAGIFRFDGTAMAPVEPYEPTLTTDTAPGGDGTELEAVNALTPKVMQRFVPDGTSTRYRLATLDIYSVDRIERDGAEIPLTQWYWDDLACAVIFLSPPLRGGSDLIIHYRVSSHDPALARRILNCRYASAFGGAGDTRVFLYGSEEAPATRYHSGMADGLPDMGYFPVLNYTLIGDGAPVTGILRHYDRQLIFTERAAYYSYLAYQTEADGRNRAIFPVLPLSDDRGNLPAGQPLLMENEPVTVTEAGLFRWVSTNVRDERNARLFSRPVREYLSAMDPRAVRLFNRKSEGELYIACGQEILVYRYGVGAFYRYRLTDLSVCYLAARDGEFYFGTAHRICRAGGETDLGQPIPAWWTSPFLTLSAKGREKNLYSAVLCADTARGGASCEFQLITPEGTVPVRETAAFPAGSRAARRRVPARHGHFERVQTRIIAGDGRLRLRYLVLKGKVCDKSI